jgi:lysophospholipase L1-like esterase
MLGHPTRHSDGELCSVDSELLAKLNRIQRQSDQIVLVTLGDSFTEGYPVFDKSYPEQLSQMLNKTNRTIKVINAGLGDSGPDIQLLLFKKFILPKIQPNIVIWTFYANDIDDNVTHATYTINSRGALTPLSCNFYFAYVRDMLYHIPSSEWFLQHSGLFRLLLYAPEVLIPIRVPKEYRQNPSIWGYRKLLAEIEEMKRISQQYHFKTYFAVIAPQAIYIHNNTDVVKWLRKDYERIRLAFQKTNTSYLDFNFLSKVPPINTNVLGASSDISTKYFSSAKFDSNDLGNRHLNVQGYSRLAETLLDIIVQSTNPSSVVNQ